MSHSAAVNTFYQGEDPKPDELYARGKLARKVRAGGKKSFSNEEITRLIACAEKRCRADPLLGLQIAEDPDKFVEKAQTPLAVVG